MPHAVVRPPLADSAGYVAVTLLPQGWGFFTKNPREPSYNLYSIESSNAVRSVDPAVESAASNLFGLRRSPRIAQGVRTAIGESIPDDRWAACVSTADVGDCLREVTVEGLQTIESPVRSTVAVYCGLFLMARAEMLPWAWRESPQDREIALVLVDIQC